MDALGHASYDPEADALYVRFREAEHGRTLGTCDDMVHVDPEGQVYAVEQLRVRERAEQEARSPAGAG